MAINYTRLAATALRLINANGRSVSVVKHSSSPADPNKPWEGPSVYNETSQTVNAVWIAIGSLQDMGFEVSPNDAARAEGALLVAGTAVANVDLEDYHKVNDGTDVYTVEWCKVLKPGGTKLLYVFGVKR